MVVADLGVRPVEGSRLILVQRLCGLVLLLSHLQRNGLGNNRETKA